MQWQRGHTTVVQLGDVCKTSKALFHPKVFLLAAVECYLHLHLTCVVLNWEIRNLRELSEQKVEI